MSIGSHTKGLDQLQHLPIVADYLRKFQTVVDQLDTTAIGQAVEVLRNARERGSLIFFAGNGGSAATATHLANDLSKATLRSGRRPMRVLSLSDNVSWLTALANDEGYDRVFEGQLINLSSPGDILVVISASGNSANLVRAVEYAGTHGMQTIGLLGFDGGCLLDAVNTPLWTQTDKGEYGVVETAHTLVGDLLTTCLIQDTAG